MASPQTIPPASLVAVSDEARAALGNRADVRIKGFPFNVGREGRIGRFEKFKLEVERRLSRHPALNDLYLVEPSSDTLHISREHFAIGYVDGQHVLVDRESALGTIVAGTQVGSDQRARQVALHDGDLITVGDASSPYVFRFQIDA